LNWRVEGTQSELQAAGRTTVPLVSPTASPVPTWNAAILAGPLIPKAKLKPDPDLRAGSELVRLSSLAA